MARLSDEEFRAWCQRNNIPSRTEAYIQRLRESDPERRVRSRASNVRGRSPSVNFYPSPRKTPCTPPTIAIAYPLPVHRDARRPAQGGERLYALVVGRETSLRCVLSITYKQRRL